MAIKQRNAMTTEVKEATISVNEVDVVYFNSNIHDENQGTTMTINIINSNVFYGSDEGRVELLELINGTLDKAKPKDSQE